MAVKGKEPVDDKPKSFEEWKAERQGKKKKAGKAGSSAPINDALGTSLCLMTLPLMIACVYIYTTGWKFQDAAAETERDTPSFETLMEIQPPPPPPPPPQSKDMYDGKVLNLDADNFPQEVLQSGKTSFVMFMAPWCGHCKKLKPVWQSLAGKFSNSEDVIIAQVDCTEDRPICQMYKVEGFPTLQYWDDPDTVLDPTVYTGERDLFALKTFVDSALTPSCSLLAKDLCNEKELKLLSKYEALSTEQVVELVKENDAALAAAEEAYTTGQKDLQTTYSQLFNETKAKVDLVNTPELLLLKSINNNVEKKETPTVTATVTEPPRNVDPMYDDTPSPRKAPAKAAEATKAKAPEDKADL